MTTIGSPPGTFPGTFACDAGSLKELLANATLSCPCCNGPLTPEKLARLLDDVQKLAQGRAATNAEAIAQPSSHVGRPAGMIIDPHAHMISRTTDDYEAMANAGVVAVIEPAFWLGQPRTNVGSFIDYFSLISGFERFRAGQFGIRHYCTIGLNPKEANNEALAEAVIDALPRFLVEGRRRGDGRAWLRRADPARRQGAAGADRTRQGVRTSDHDSHSASRQAPRHTANDGCAEGTWLRSGALRHRPQQRRDRFARFATAAIGARFRFIPTPRWAASEWPRSSRATAPSV